MAKPQPTREQARALLEFRNRKGHQWKSRLRNHWAADRRMPETSDAHLALLRQVRNEFGPSWLQTVTLETLLLLAYPPLYDNRTARRSRKVPGVIVATPTPDLDPYHHGIELVRGDDHKSLAIKHSMFRVTIPTDQVDLLISALCMARDQGWVEVIKQTPEEEPQ